MEDEETGRNPIRPKKASTNRMTRDRLQAGLSWDLMPTWHWPLCSLSLRATGLAHCALGEVWNRTPPPNGHENSPVVSTDIPLLRFWSPCSEGGHVIKNEDFLETQPATHGYK